METNVSFSYEADDIFRLVDAETSRHAAFLRYQDGGSAYDALKVHTKDKPVIAGYITDAFRSILSRFSGEGTYYYGDDHRAAHTLNLYLPDFDENLYEAARFEVSRHVVLSSTARWLMDRSFGEYAKMVAEDSDASMNRLVGMLRTRKFPIDE